MTQRDRDRLVVTPGGEQAKFPFPVSPRGTPGRAGFPPPTPEARCAPAKSAGTHRCCRLPPQEGCAPLCIPRYVACGELQLALCPRPEPWCVDGRPPAVRDARRESIADGRHVGLDFYDLLTEASMDM